MSASEEQIAAHRADEEARARAERERRDAFIRELKEAYDEARAAALLAGPEEPGVRAACAYHERQRRAHEAGLLAAAQRACRIHVADLLRIECDLNAVTIDKRVKRGHEDMFAACAAVGAMRRLRARMRGKVRP